MIRLREGLAVRATHLVSSLGLIITILITRSSASSDSLGANEIIRDSNETIVSLGGNFELGFFSPGNSNNNHRYLGIWYKKRASGTLVWVANRDKPLTNTTGGVLKLTSDGLLVLLPDVNSSISSSIWSSNTSQSSISSSPVLAQLLDTGNLVIRNKLNLLIWQSFDFPDNTFLPGMKLGRDLVSGHNWSLSSWKTNDDPSPGNYTLELDIGGYPQILLRKKLSASSSAIQFRLGPWNGIGFSGMPTLLGSKQIFTYQFVINEKEIYYKYEVVDNSLLMKLTMDTSGQVARATWIDAKNKWEPYVQLQADACDTYSRCGPYGSCDISKAPACQCLTGFQPESSDSWGQTDWSNGCVRKTPLNCQGRDTFVTYSNKKMPDTQNSWYNVTMDIKECKAVCLSNCNCTAYTNTNISGRGSGCLLWFGDLIDIREEPKSAQYLYVRVAASGSGENKSRVKKILLFLFFGILIILAVALSRYLLQVFKYRRHQREGETRFNDENTTDSYEDGREDLPLFDFRTVANATNNFSINSKLGEGGFGPVYKGILEDGQEIAVKRLSISSRQGIEEFKNEVLCIAKLQHRNLVRLLGCSTAGSEKMLIYEYMPNKSLDYFIFGDFEQRKLLDWPKRYNIINGIAKGLLYLHVDSRLRVIHRDLKASNVLLDYEMNPRISDFGMARSFGGSETEAQTARVVGTYGYMPPEYAIDGLFSVKSDVYSFGVLVIEIVSGKKNRFFRHPDHDLNLLGHAWRSFKEDKLLEVIDGALLELSNQGEVFRVLLIGLLCVQQYPEDRPSMSSVVLMLSSQVSLPQPKQPGFFTERRLQDTDSSSSLPEHLYCIPASSCSANQTITMLQPR